MELFGLIVALASLGGLLWYGLTGWERLVRIRRKQDPASA